jgi:hypothetical protein
LKENKSKSLRKSNKKMSRTQLNDNDTYIVEIYEEGINQPREIFNFKKWRIDEAIYDINEERESGEGEYEVSLIKIKNLTGELILELDEEVFEEWLEEFTNEIDEDDEDATQVQE